MGRVLTNNTTLQWAAESSTIGTLPGSPTWHEQPYTSMGKFGATISTTEQKSISKKRSRSKGRVTDLDSGVEFESNWTLSAFVDFIEAFLFSTAKQPGGTGTGLWTPTAVVDSTPDSYTVPAGGALAANILVYARGFTNSANNGLKTTTSGSTATSVNVSDTLVAEASPPTNAELEVAGFVGATGDLQIDSGGNLISTVLDFTTLGITVGTQLFFPTAANGGFSNASNVGAARVSAVAANQITLEKKQQAFATDNGSGLAVKVFMGRFIRDVNVDHADYLTRTFHFEAAFQNLGSSGATNYQYAKGNMCNQVSFQLPLGDLAKVSYNFIGTDTPIPTGTRETNAASPILANRDSSLAGIDSSDLARLRIQKTDETGISTDFKSMSLTLNNNVSPEKVLGTLGAKYVNTGDFTADVEAQMLFTDPEVPTAIRNNTTLGLDFLVKGDDGAIAVDLPSMTLGDGALELTVNESVKINTKSGSFEDSTLGFSIGVTVFPYLP